MWCLKSYEGFHQKTYWDVNRWSYGWGAKAKNRNDIIDLDSANYLVRENFQNQYDRISKTYPNLDRFTALMISVLDYNIGEIGQGLHKALEAGDKIQIAHWVQKYNKTAKGCILYTSPSPRDRG